MSGTSLRSQKARSSISPLQSRKSPAAPHPAPSMSKTGARPTTPSCSRPSSSKFTVSPANSASPSTPSLDRPDFSKAKENVTVTVRFRPLSAREINKGDEIALSETSIILRYLMDSAPLRRSLQSTTQCCSVS